MITCAPRTSWKQRSFPTSAWWSPAPRAGDTVDLRAQLTIKGTTAPLPLRTNVAVLDDGAVRVTAQATIDRKDFGVDGNVLGMVTDMATISGDVVFRRG